MSSYYDAVLVDGRWRYAFKASDGTLTHLGYCGSDEGHETADDALDCFAKFLSDAALPFAYRGSRYPCEVCGTISGGGMSARDWAHVNLCEEHRTPEIFAERMRHPGRGEGWTDVPAPTLIEGEASNG